MWIFEIVWILILFQENVSVLVDRTVAILPVNASENEDAFLSPKIPFSHPSADVPLNFTSKRNLFTLAFFVETLSTGFDVHLIKDDVFDEPNKREQLIAVIVSRMWSRLSLMGRIDDILTSSSSATAERYIASSVNSTERKNIFEYHYDNVERRLKADPELHRIYVKVRKEIQQSKRGLAPLSSGTIDLCNVKTILRRAQIEYLTNVKLRKMLLNLKFANRAFGMEKKLNRSSFNYSDYDLLARAILLLSAKSNIADQVQFTYDETIQVVLETEARNPRLSEDRFAEEKLLFLTLSHFFENNLKLNRELIAMKKMLSKKGG